MAMEDVWAVGEAYEAYVGRWSRRVAVAFLSWLDRPAGLRWLDVGCGTGALTASILASADPREVVGADPSPGMLGHARAATVDARVRFEEGDARSLPLPDGHFDVVVSGLALNFVPEPDLAVAECVRVSTVDGMVAAYVWDYADRMAMMRHFWDAAADVDPAAADRDEGRRFPLCRPEPLRDLWSGAGLSEVGVVPIDIDTVFASFDDLWQPFLGGQGSAPTYTMSLSEEVRAAIRESLRERLPTRDDGSIALTARAWAVRGERRH
jgi:SAM-dependent methyltransferase